MNQQEIFKKIGGIIAELKDQYTYLQAAKNTFNDLELELFMANANFLTDHIAILQKINHQVIPVQLPVAKPILQIEEIPMKPQIPDYFDEQDLLYAEKESSEFNNIEPEIVKSPLEEVPQQETIILPELMPQNELEEVVNTSFIEQKSSPELMAQPETGVKDDAFFIDQKSLPKAEEVFVPKEELTAEPFLLQPEIVSPKIKEEIFVVPNISPVENFQSKKLSAEPEPVLTLNERIAAQKGLDQPKSETLNKTVQDLQSIISLNDKLLFVKELFNGYNLAYAEAINILNRYSNFEQAENLLNQNYAVKNSWKDKPLTAEKFMNLLRKKFV